MRDYKKLDVWKKAHELYMQVKKNIASQLPKEEKYELCAQMQRAALSIPLNIVKDVDVIQIKILRIFLIIHWVRLMKRIIVVLHLLSWDIYTSKTMTQ